MEKLTYTVKEAAAVLGLSEDSIRKMDANGVLPRLKKIPGCIRFSRRDVLACADIVDLDVRPSQIRQLKAELEKEQAENKRLKCRFRQLCAAINKAAADEGM